MTKHSRVVALKWNLHLQSAAGKCFRVGEVPGCSSGPSLTTAAAAVCGDAADPARPNAGDVLEHLLLLPTPPPPAEWWFKVGMWSTQMSSSRRSLFSRIISLTTHFSLSLSWLWSRDLPVCLVWGLTAATLLDPPWCILFSLKLIRSAIAYGIALGEEGVGYESCAWSEDTFFFPVWIWGVIFSVNIYRNSYTTLHGVGEIWKSNLIILLYIKHRSSLALQQQYLTVTDFPRWAKSPVVPSCTAEPQGSEVESGSWNGSTSRWLDSLRWVLGTFQSNIVDAFCLKLFISIAFRNCVIPYAILNWMLTNHLSL